MAYETLLLGDALSPLSAKVQVHFDADRIATVDRLGKALAEKNYRVLVVDAMGWTKVDMEFCQALFSIEQINDLPVILLCSTLGLKDKLKAFDIGCDDLIDGTRSLDEVCARINKSIFHRIATEQLSQRLLAATETVQSALTDADESAKTIQFLLHIHDCDNLDQLGQLLFATIGRYGLACSLQMRTEMGIKDMEANGMAKDLESQLLTQLRNRGRFVDFGRRTIVNVDRVSLLIRNMPTDNPEDYDTLKANITRLLQGVNARIVALEDQFRLMQEKESLRQLASDAHRVIDSLKAAIQDATQDICQQVTLTSDRLQQHLSSQLQTHKDDPLFQQVTANLMTAIHRTFHEGLNTDELFMRLEKAIERSLRATSEPAGQLRQPLDRDPLRKNAISSSSPPLAQTPDKNP